MSGSLMAPWAKYASDDDLDSHYTGAGKQYGVDPDLLRSVVDVESGGNQYAQSPQNAQGLTQIIPSTQRELGVTDPWNPKQSIYGAAKYLRQQMDTFDRPEFAVAAYHGGPDSDQWGPRTKDYLSKVTRAYEARKARQPAQQPQSGPWDRYQGDGAPASGDGPWTKYQGAPAASQPKGSRWPVDLPSSEDRPMSRAETLRTLPMAQTEAEAPLPPIVRPGEVPGTALAQAVEATDAKPQAATDAPGSALAQATEANEGNGSPIPAPLARVGEAAAQGWEESPPLFEENYVKGLETSPFLWHRYLSAPIARAGNAAVAAPNAAFRAWQEAITQLGVAAGQPQLGRDLAAMPEAFMGTPNMFSRETVLHDIARGRVPRPGSGLPSLEPNAPAPSQAAPAVAPQAGGMPVLDRMAQEARQEAPTPPPGSGAAITQDIANAREEAARLRADVDQAKAAAAAAPVESTPAPPPPQTVAIPQPGPIGQIEVRATRPPEAAVEPPPAPIVPEPRGDTLAQLRAISDPASGKDTVFIPSGTTFTQEMRAAAPKGAKIVVRKGVGRLITTDPEKAATFRTAPEMTEAHIGRLLGYPETKGEALASGEPVVIQGRDQAGNVVHESVASPEGARAAADRAIEAVPDGELVALTPAETIERRVREAADPYDTVPKEPQRLIDFLRQPTVLNRGTIHEQRIPGGLQDTGGDLSAILGGTRGRPGLISGKGRTLDDAAQAAWEAGYFPGHTERPSINELLDAIRDDHHGVARYSHNDIDAVQRYQDALTQNAEIDRLSSDHGIPTRGVTRDQFFDALHEKLSVDDWAREMASQEAAQAREVAAVRQALTDWERDHPPELAMQERQAGRAAEEAPSRTLEELEREYQQEGTTGAAGRDAEAREGPGSSSSVADAGQERGGPDRGGAADAGRAGEEEEFVGGKRPIEGPTPKNFWTYQAPTPPGPPIGMTVAQWESLSPGMRREIFRQQPERWQTPTDLLGQPAAAPRAPSAPEPTIRNDPRQIGLAGTEPSAIQAQAARDAGRGTLRGEVPQKAADEGLFAPDTSGQGTLYGGPGAIFDLNAWKRFFSPLPPKRTLPKQEPPGGMFEPPREPPQGPKLPPEVEAARLIQGERTKNLNPVERFFIFPRVLSSLDTRSARFWNAWNNREVEASRNVDALRQNITPTFLKLNEEGKNRVAAALEIGRIAPEGLSVNDAGRLVVRNDTVPFARWSKVGDVIELTPEQTRGFSEAKRLGDQQWDMLMRGAARRYGWAGDMDIDRIKAAAEEYGDTPTGKKLKRVADLLDMMQAAKQDIYFPMMRFGQYYIAIRPKSGHAVVEQGGGRPRLAWFETVEKPGLQDLLGKSEGALTVRRAADKRMRELHEQFPPDKFDYEHGDFSRRPGLLKKMDIPAIEKLFMLMENSVQASIRERVMREGDAKGPRAIRQEARSRYQDLHGATVDAFFDALFEELKAGYRRKANVVPGYSADFGRAIGTHMKQVASNTADMVHRDAIETAYNEIQDYHPHRSVADYWKRWRDFQDNPSDPLTRAANNMSQVGYAYVLGMSPSSTIIDAMSTPLASGPVLSVGVGPRHAVPALVRGLGQAYRALGWGRHGLEINLERATRGMTPEKQAFMHRLAGEGLLEAVGAKDMSRMNEATSSLLTGDRAALWHRGLEIAMSNVSAMDQANRLGVASAAWDIASDPKKLNAAAKPWMENDAAFYDMVQNQGLTRENFTRFMLSEAAFQWGRENRAPWMRSAPGTLMSALHGYQTRYLSNTWKLLNNMGPQGKVAGALMMGALWAGAGLQGMPFAQDAAGLVNSVWKYLTGRNPAIEGDIRDLIADSDLGKAGAEAIMNGPASYLTGVDLSQRVGYGDVVARQLDPVAMIGTFPSIAWQSWTAARQRAQSDQSPWAVAAEAAPFALRGPLRALAAQEQGTLTRRGVPVVPPEQFTGADIGKMATGFTPMSVASARQEREQFRQQSDVLDAVRGMVKAGQIDEARTELVRLGWSRGRIIGFMQSVLRGPTPGVQFQRWQEQRRQQRNPSP